MGLKSVLEKLNIPFIKPEVQPGNTGDVSIANLLQQILLALQSGPNAGSGVNAGQATTVTAVAAATATPTTIKGSPGRCFDIIVTTVGTAAIVITSGGVTIAEVPASAAIGRYPFNSPATTSIIAGGSANLPSFSILWA